MSLLEFYILGEIQELTAFNEEFIQQMFIHVCYTDGTVLGERCTTGNNRAKEEEKGLRKVNKEMQEEEEEKQKEMKEVEVEGNMIMSNQ